MMIQALLQHNARHLIYSNYSIIVLAILNMFSAREQKWIEYQ